jgi:hypothetical protein
MAGAGPEGPSTFPAVAGGYLPQGGLSNAGTPGTYACMINRGDIIWLGVASGVTGGLIGGLMLGIGIAMMISGIYFGLLLVCIGGPASGLIGWLMARRLAKQLHN